MKVSNHAKQRGEERLGLSPEPFIKLAGKALEYGLKHSETTGQLHKYITWLYMRSGTANNTRIYGQFVYLFHNDILITVFNLPNEFKAVVSKLKLKTLKNKI